mgnify:CR=1 FL=1
MVNVCNFAKGAPSLLSYDDARTLFHEFGHALHQMLSDVTYGFISGTSVARDFVELPSQLYEHWLEVPEVLEKHARHYQTGEPMPGDMLKRLLAAGTYDQGFATVEFVSSAMVDLELTHFRGQPVCAGFKPALQTFSGSVQRCPSKPDTNLGPRRPSLENLAPCLAQHGQFQ